MFPFIVVTEQIRIPLYGLMFVTGFFVALIIARKIAPHFGGTKEDTLYAAMYGAIGIMVGARAMYFFTKLPAIIMKFDSFLVLLKGDFMLAMEYAFGGLVFYGGLIGAVAGAWIYCRQYKVPFAPIVDTYAPLMPFIHGFGRIGCFCSGCCYGIEYHGPFSVRFPYNELVPELSEVPRVPVQLMEAGLNFIVFGVLMCVGMKVKVRAGQLMGMYLLYYTVARFLLEMLRGDKLRGVFGGVSTSQIISVLLIPAAVYLVLGRLDSSKAVSGKAVSDKDVSGGADNKTD